MARQKQEMGVSGMDRGKNASPMQRELENTVESFEKRWGIQLTRQETGEVVERAISRIAESKDELRVKPAIRDEMFAMLIRKDPEKAISFRINAYDKKGRGISASQKRAVLKAAEAGGFKEAREKLEEFVKKGKADARAIESRPKSPQRKIALEVPTKTKPKEESQKAGETVVEQAYRLAKQKNEELGSVVKECGAELASLEKEYYGRGGKMSKAKTEKEGEALVKEFNNKRKVMQKSYLDKTNKLKKERDQYAKKYLQEGTRTLVGASKMNDAAVEQFIKKQTKMLTEFAGASSVGREYGVKKFALEDLSLNGAAGMNVGHFEANMKSWEKEREKRTRV